MDFENAKELLEIILTLPEAEKRKLLDYARFLQSQYAGKECAQ